MDLVKHHSLFNSVAADKLGSRAVIGAGSVGSAMIMGLAKLGLTRLYLQDFDKVETENIPNQYIYGPENIGQRKVLAAFNRVLELTGTLLTLSERPYKGERLEHYAVYSCVDTMKVRRAIFTKGLYINPYCKWFFDVRTGIDTFSVFALQTQNAAHRKAYESSLYKDSDIVVAKAECGTTLSLGPVAQMAANFAMVLTVQAFNDKLKHNEFHFNLDDLSVVKRSY